MFRYNDTSVVITAWNPIESLAYEEIWKYRPAADNSKATMELKIVNHPEGLVLDIRRIHDTSPGLFLMAWGRIFNPKGMAFGALDSMIGPSSAHASAWAGGWKKLPIRSAEVRPAKLSEPSIL